MARVFVSHTEEDGPIARALVEVLQLALGLAKDQIFCSSVRGTIKTAQHVATTIKDNLQDTALAVLLVTPAYLLSDYCKWELGAIWVKEPEIPTFPLLLKPLTYEDVDNPVVSGKKAGYVDDPRALDDLYEEIKSRLGKMDSPLADWHERRDLFVRRVPELVDECKPSKRTTARRALERKARVGTASPHIHNALHCLRDAAFVRIREQRAYEAHRAEFIELVGQALTHFAEAFSVMTDVPCRGCIKQHSTYEGTAQTPTPLVFDLVRSHGLPRTSTPESLDFVHDNTDFEQLYQRNSNVFCCNDLVALYQTGGYKNSHWKVGLPAEPGYVATMVWPIRKILQDDATASKFGLVENDHLVGGFLCVDAKVPDVFDEEVHFGIGAAFADTLYHVLQPWLPGMQLMMAPTGQ